MTIKYYRFKWVVTTIAAAVPDVIIYWLISLLFLAPYIRHWANAFLFISFQGLQEAVCFHMTRTTAYLSYLFAGLFHHNLVFFSFFFLS